MEFLYWMKMLSKHVVLSNEVYNHLVEQGRKNESFDAVLRRLLGLGN